MDIDAVSKTIRTTVGAEKRHTSRYQVLKGLTTSFGDIEHEIDAVWKTESPLVWYVTFHHKCVVEKL